MANSNPNTSGLKPPWSATNQPKGVGRKPSKTKKYIKDNNLSASDVSAMAKYILPMTKSDIYAFIKDDKVPLVMQLFAKGVLADYKNSNYRNLLILLDRAVGKAPENITINSNNQNFNHDLDYNNLSEDDAKTEFFRKLNEAKG